MIAILLILLTLFALLILLRIILCISFYGDTKKNIQNFDEKDYTVLQPIMSGDPNLERCLRTNLEKTKKVLFVWVIDKDDELAIQITNKIKTDYDERIKIIIAEPYNSNKSSKTFKLKQAKKIKTKYTVLLDDDTTVDWANFYKVQNALANSNTVVSGFPHYSSDKGFYSSFFASVINSILPANVSIYQFGKYKSLNGMFYCLETEIIYKYKLYENIEGCFMDDYTATKYLTGKGMPIKHIDIPFSCTTNIASADEFMGILRRWGIYGREFSKENFSVYLFCLGILPFIMPPILLVSCFYTNIYFAIIFLIVLFAKIVFNFIIHKKVYNAQQNIFEFSFYELLFDFSFLFLLPIVFIGGNEVSWRGKKIKL